MACLPKVSCMIVVGKNTAFINIMAAMTVMYKGIWGRSTYTYFESVQFPLKAHFAGNVYIENIQFSEYLIFSLLVV